MRTILTAALLLLSGLCFAASDVPLLLQTPTLSKTGIAFAYGGDIWTVDRAGGAAKVLAAGPANAIDPVFSPDGTLLAYSANVDGNYDAFVVPAAGGRPQRLTWHPDADAAVGWTPDGRNVLLRSHRASANDSDKLFEVALTGGLPQALPLPMAEDGAYSPDGTRIAYSPVFQWEPDWRLYRGGQTTPVWIARLSDSSITKIPRDNSNDSNPMWIGDAIYFLSDRNGPDTLFAYDLGSGKVTQLIENDGFNIDSAAAGPGAIVYSQMGELHLYDLATHTSRPVDVTVAGALPETRPQFRKIADEIVNAGISSTGQRAVFEAHGEILTVPAKKGGARNITRTPGAAERDPAWSPDGKWIAWFSDASGEYALYIRSQDGLEPPRKIGLGEPPSFFYSPVWSPDSSKIAYSDKRLNLWYVALDDSEPVKVDTDRFETPLHEFDPVWSPDGRWLAYTKQLPNHLRAVFVYSLEDRRATQVTDGMSDCLYPNFDVSGKYLYFTASTDMGLTTGWLDMTSESHPVTRSVYVAVLRENLPSPLKPLSDEEKGDEEKGKTDTESDKDKADQEKEGKDKEDESGAPEPVQIDFDGILQRTLALPIDAANYVGMRAGKTGELYLLEAAQVMDPQNEHPPLKLQKFDLEKRETKQLVDEITDFALSADGAKMLYRKSNAWFIAKTDEPPKPGDGKLGTDSIKVHVVPRAEWSQMYREVWRIERDFFYDSNYHGYDIGEAEKRFAAYLPGIASREDLNFLFRKMLAYMSVGHMFVRGGAEPDRPKVKVGLLGADYTADHDRYRFAKIYSGENWNPGLHAPLTQPGVNVQAGEYLLAVNGKELHAPDNVYRPFQDTVGAQVVLTVGPNPDGGDSRQVTVVPIEDDFRLRHLNWIESNMRTVAKLSDGKLAYVYLPDTAVGGFTSFNRYFFAQTDRQGAVIDERYNHGGQLADYIIDGLRRPVMSIVMSRDGEPYSEPTQAIQGPKAMLINQFSGSGGDALPWYFQRTDLGPLIGMRTWGGLVGIGGYPQLMDGGSVTAPRWAIYGLHGQWEVENHGIAPDIQVWQDPKLVRQGHDPQLEKAVEVLLQKLREHPLPKYEQPPYPDYRPTLPPPD